MNKTVNINLAGILFHIDEDAFLKLQNYLDTIKQSFVNEPGRDEIISDIEARIAELFSQKRGDVSQVISTTDVAEMIAIMGEPEDYNVDEELFENAAPKASQQRTVKRLFRDSENSYVGGVTAGLGHYFGIDPIWLRLAWIVLTLSSGGGFVLIYLALWIFVPEAKTTAERLIMKGQPINVSNIERKIKEGFDNVSDTVKNADYSKLKNSSSVFFDRLIDIIKVLLKVGVKVIGAGLVFIAGTVLISLFLALFGVSIFNFSGAEWIDYVSAVNIGVPLWLASLFAFLVVGIPHFFLLILGLKIIIPNLKSIGKPAKLSLLGLWLAALAVVIFLGVRQATVRAFDATTTVSKELNIAPTDTLQVKMRKDDRYISRFTYNDDFKISQNPDGEKVLVFRNVRIFVETKKYGTPTMTVTKKADGSTYDNARNRSEAILYKYDMEQNTLLLDGYALTDYENKFADQEVRITLSIPETMTLLADKTTRVYNTSRNNGNNTIIRNREDHYLRFKNGKVICTSCKTANGDKPDWEQPDWETRYINRDKGIDINLSEDGENFRLKIDENGIRINNKQVVKRKDWNDDDGLDIDFENEDGKNFNLKIDEDGIRINNKPVDVKIDEDGIRINN